MSEGWSTAISQIETRFSGDRPTSAIHEDLARPIKPAMLTPDRLFSGEQQKGISDQ